MTYWRAGLAAALATLATAAPAHAATLSRSGTTLVFAAAPGEENRPQVMTSPGVITINDGNDVATGPGCSTDATTAATGCSLDGVRKMVFRLGDLDDELRLDDNVLRTTMTFRVDGGSGNDHIRGTKRNEVVDGGSGADTIQGSGGRDTIKGGSGKDLIFGFGTLDGGPGNDMLDAGSASGLKAFASRVLGGTGNDSIIATNKVRDVVDCGAGKDTATTHDKRGYDRISRNCERGDRFPLD
jgi:Ca2+-binding RTX toxin-like protein